MTRRDFDDTEQKIWGTQEASKQTNTVQIATTNNERRGEGLKTMHPHPEQQTFVTVDFHGELGRITRYRTDESVEPKERRKKKKI